MAKTPGKPKSAAGQVPSSEGKRPADGGKPAGTIRRGTPQPESATSPRHLIARKREGQAVELRLQGKSLNEIARRLGYASHSSVQAALERGMTRLSPPENAEQLRDLEVMKCHYLESQAWDQWFRSCEDAEKFVMKTEADGSATKTETVEGQSGNPSLLSVVLQAMERNARLLGLDMPTKVKIEEDGLRVAGKTRDQVDEEFLTKLAQRVQERRAHAMKMRQLYGPK